MAKYDDGEWVGNYEGTASVFVPNHHPKPANPKDSPVPTIDVIWTTVPSVTVQAASGTSAATAPAHDDFSVALPSITAAEQDMLSSAGIVVGDYKALKDHVLATQDYIFGQQIDIADMPGGNTQDIDGTATSNLVRPDEFRAAAQDYADSRNPTQHGLLKQVGDTMEIVGQYIAALRDAANCYATADNSSLFPAPGTPTPT
jgi:hypothetical protein